jgi:hypothetical protein
MHLRMRRTWWFLLLFTALGLFVLAALNKKHEVFAQSTLEATVELNDPMLNPIK